MELRHCRSPTRRIPARCPRSSTRSCVPSGRGRGLSPRTGTLRTVRVRKERLVDYPERGTERSTYIVRNLGLGRLALVVQSDRFVTVGPTVPLLQRRVNTSTIRLYYSSRARTCELRATICSGEAFDQRTVVGYRRRRTHKVVWLVERPTGVDTGIVEGEPSIVETFFQSALSVAMMASSKMVMGAGVSEDKGRNQRNKKDCSGGPRPEGEHCVRTVEREGSER